jgi:hypothetical protein
MSHTDEYQPPERDAVYMLNVRQLERGLDAHHNET